MLSQTEQNPKYMDSSKHRRGHKKNLYHKKTACGRSQSIPAQKINIKTIKPCSFPRTNQMSAAAHRKATQALSPHHTFLSCYEKKGETRKDWISSSPTHTRSR